MIYYFLLLCLPITNILQNISQKQYGVRYKSSNVILFSAVTSVIALCFFLIISGLKLDFTPSLLPCAIAFALGYSSAWVGTVLALRFGSMAISMLIISFSLIFPTLYGIVLGDAFTSAIAVGMILLIAAIILVNISSFNSTGKFSMKWFACVMMAFIGNGVCGISQNISKRMLGESYSNTFMILALAISAVLLFGFAAVKSGHHLVTDLKTCLPFACINGTANAVHNFLIMILIGNIPNTVLYPTNSALGMSATFLLAFIVYRERFSKFQYLGYILGVISIFILNL